MTSTTVPHTETRRPAAPLSKDLIAVGAAVVCALVLWGTWALLGDSDLSVRNGNQTTEVGGVAVAVFTAGIGLLGVGALRLLERVTPKALTIWTILAVAITLISALGPLGATSVAAMGVLLGLHAVVAVVLIVAVHRSRRTWSRQ
ncbi:DUF6069 family protein [Propionibacteriaceae bacterium Y1685]